MENSALRLDVKELQAITHKARKEKKESEKHEEQKRKRAEAAQKRKEKREWPEMQRKRAEKRLPEIAKLIAEAAKEGEGEIKEKILQDEIKPDKHPRKIGDLILDSSSRIIAEKLSSMGFGIKVSSLPGHFDYYMEIRWLPPFI